MDSEITRGRQMRLRTRIATAFGAIALVALMGTSVAAEPTGSERMHVDAPADLPVIDDLNEAVDAGRMAELAVEAAELTEFENFIESVAVSDTCVIHDAARAFLGDETRRPGILGNMLSDYAGVVRSWLAESGQPGSVALDWEIRGVFIMSPPDAVPAIAKLVEGCPGVRVTEVAVARSDLEAIASELEKSLLAQSPGSFFLVPSETVGMVLIGYDEAREFTAAEVETIRAASTDHPDLIGLLPQNGPMEEDVTCSFPDGNECTTPLRGGQMIQLTDELGETGGRCTTGFIVRGNSSNVYTMTAGHCGFTGESWDYRIGNGANWTDVYLGDVHASYYLVGADAAIIDSSQEYRSKVIDERISGSLKYQTVTSEAGYPVLYDSVCMTGAVATDTTCGVVTDSLITVTRSNGITYYLTQANYCRGPGDSGGHVFRGTYAVGVHSGSTSSATCGTAVFEQMADYRLDNFSVDAL